MSAFARLLRRLASMGLKNVSALDPSRPEAAASPSPPHQLPPGRLRIHLFGATFADQGQADRFCYVPPQPDYPVQLTRELEGAYIDLAEVEVVCGAVEPRLLEFLDPADADDIMLRLGADNSLIILTERAFSGLPYSLDDTESLTYLGAIVVDE